MANDTNGSRLLIPAIYVEVQRNEAAQPFAIVDPPNAADLEVSRRRVLERIHI
jgi:hypothetical protein